MSKSNDEIHPVFLLKDVSNNNSIYFEFRHDDIINYRNSALILNRPGIYLFHSVYNKMLYPFRSETDTSPRSPVFVNDMSARESVAALMSVKDSRDYRDSIWYDKRYVCGLTLESKEKDYDLYSFDYYIPMGFAYDSYVPKEDIEKLNAKADSVDVPLLLLDNLAVNSEDISELSQYLHRGEINHHISIDSISRLRRKYTSENFRGDTKGFTCTTDFDSTKVVFFSVAADPGFTAYIDGEKAKIYNVNLGMSAIVVPAGKHFIQFSYFPPGLKLGTTMSTIALLTLIGLYLHGIKCEMSSHSKI